MTRQGGEMVAAPVQKPAPNNRRQDVGAPKPAASVGLAGSSPAPDTHNVNVRELQLHRGLVSAWHEAVAALTENVWAPIGTTYHRLAIDTAAISMSFCGLVISEQSRYFVTPDAGPNATPCVGEQCAMCRAKSLYPGKLEASS